MGLFDTVRSLVGGDESDGREVPTPAAGDLPVGEGREPSPTAFRNSAVDAVQQWDDYDLDFSLDSLAALDDLARKRGPALDVIADEQGADAAADRHIAYTVQTGSYLAEVVIRNCGGEWVQDGEDWRVRVGQGDDVVDVDVFEVASYSFAEEPAFGEVRARLPDQSKAADTDDSAESATATEGDETEGGFDTAEMTEYAEEVASVYDGYDLDFTPSSLARLDSLADTEFDPDRFADAEIGGDDMDSGLYTELLKQLGSYFGEVLVREHDGEWERRDGEVVVSVSGEEGASAVAPVFETAAESLTGPSQFASVYNAVTSEANVYAPEVADHAAVMPESGDEEPVDNEGPAVGRVTDAAEDTSSESPAGTDDTEGTAAEPASTAPASHSGTESDGAAAGADGPTASPEASAGTGESTGQDGPESVDEAVDTVEPTEPGPSEADEGFDVAAAAKEVVGDDIGERSPTNRPEGEVPDTDARSSDESSVEDTPGETAERQSADDVPAEGETLDLGGGSDTDEGPPTPSKLRDDAAAFAATWPAYDLDDSAASLSRLDSLVSEEYPDIASRDAQFRRARAAEIGGYFGEVCRTALDGTWRAGDDGEPTLVVTGPAGDHRVEPLAVAAARFEGETTLAEAFERVCERVGAR